MTGFASLCFLSYQRPAFIVKAVTSALENASYPVEVIVHDDGSDSATQEALRSLHDSGLISLLMLNAPMHNEGQGIALNRMFNAAKGDPLIKLDHDLIFNPGWLKTCMDLIGRNLDQRTSCIHGQCPTGECWRECEDAPPRIGALGLFKYPVEPVRYEDMFLKDWGGYEECRDFVGSAMVIPRAAWEKFGPFEERSAAFAEDNVFKLGIASDPGWMCALPSIDQAVNQGFGEGPSTVVVRRDGQLTSREIKVGPRIIGPDEMAAV